eukprot:6182591-Pleurochrysis_carterae.AAC.1
MYSGCGPWNESLYDDEEMPAQSYPSSCQHDTGVYFVPHNCEAAPVVYSKACCSTTTGSCWAHPWGMHGAPNIWSCSPVHWSNSSAHAAQLQSNPADQYATPERVIFPSKQAHSDSPACVFAPHVTCEESEEDRAAATMAAACQLLKRAVCTCQAPTPKVCSRPHPLPLAHACASSPSVSFAPKLTCLAHGKLTCLACSPSGHLCAHLPLCERAVDQPEHLPRELSHLRRAARQRAHERADCAGGAAAPRPARGRPLVARHAPLFLQRAPCAADGDDAGGQAARRRGLLLRVLVARRRRLTLPLERARGRLPPAHRPPPLRHA